ncbi:unnamed protein product, partial [Ectocarpus sp. 12 AP-2014]
PDYNRQPPITIDNSPYDKKYTLTRRPLRQSVRCPRRQLPDSKMPKTCALFLADARRGASKTAPPVLHPNSACARYELGGRQLGKPSTRKLRLKHQQQPRQQQLVQCATALSVSSSTSSSRCFFFPWRLQHCSTAIVKSDSPLTLVVVVEVAVAVLLATARERGQQHRVLSNAVLQLPVEVPRHRLPVLGDGV